MTLLDDAAKAICCPNGCQNKEIQHSVCQAHTWIEEARAALDVVAKWLDDETEALTQRIPNKFGNYAKDNLISRADQLQRCAAMLRKENG